MATPAQVLAAQQNGALSHGPVTAEGKARSSQNAVKTGIFARTRILPSESEADYARHERQWLDLLQPTPGLESEIADEIIFCRWRIFRVWRAEAAALAALESNCENEPDALAFGRTLAQFRRVEDSLRRQYEAAEARLYALQAIRITAHPTPQSSNCENEPPDLSAVTPTAPQPAPVPFSKRRGKPWKFR